MGAPSPSDVGGDKDGRKEEITDSQEEKTFGRSRQMWTRPHRIADSVFVVTGICNL